MGGISEVTQKITGADSPITKSTARMRAVAANAEANAAANAANSTRRKRKQGSSLLATGAAGVADSGSALLAPGATAGKNQLGA